MSPEFIIGWGDEAHAVIEAPDTEAALDRARDLALADGLLGDDAHEWAEAYTPWRAEALGIKEAS